MGLKTIFTTGLLAVGLLSSTACAAPSAQAAPSVAERDVTPRAGNWWFSDIDRQGTVAFSSGDNYKIFRNVKDYGAKGDGSTDDTAAINSAVADGNRCGQGCDSTTITPAIIYFPPGTYMVSKPINTHYYTQLVGDFNTVPTLKATANFEGMAVIDADPYVNGVNWFTNQNNFFRQVRNFKIDLTGMPKTAGAGIHWQVAQATSLQNIEFHMIEDTSEQNAQVGIFMDNGSGGFMTDLTFIGGKYGAFFGNQQFTTRNLKFKNCNTAIFMNWNWVWTLHGVDIDGCGVGLDIANGGQTQLVGSVLLLDSKIANTPVGVNTVYDPAQSGGTNGTLVLDNVDMSSNVPVAVKNTGTGATILAGNTKIASWIQGRAYSGGSGKAVQGTQTPITKPAAILGSDGRVVTKSKPQYGDVDKSKFVSVKAKGAKGDGSTDDTKAIQAIFDSIGADEIVYFDHGAYIITDTVKVPKNVKIVGEIWPLIMAGGNSAFKDEKNPKPVWQVGQAGDVGNVEIQDLMFETQGPQPGAILMEWNVAGETAGSAGMFDVHMRVGGSAGTKLQSDTCKKTPEKTTTADPNCIGSFMLIHVTKEASVYLENTWFWVSDHELDLADHSQINIYNGRGVLIESTKGAWLWGTASEHNQMYNYQFKNAANVYMALIQTETAYMQGNPDALTPFEVNTAFSDPDFKATCTGSDTCARTWGFRAIDSKDIFLYGGGLYSFFNNYDQECVAANNCQDNMISLENSSVHMYAVSTKASVNMVTVDGKSAALDKDNRNNFCAAIALLSTS
ncbi:Fc.00g108540.m01.CDS01 [Cosmosporella sp. VM-42]